MKLLSCPLCGYDIIKFEFEYDMTYGHGDSGYVHGRMMCKRCFLAKGNHSDYGEPTDEIKAMATQDWNTMVKTLNRK